MSFSDSEEEYDVYPSDHPILQIPNYEYTEEEWNGNTCEVFPLNEELVLRSEFMKIIISPDFIVRFVINSTKKSKLKNRLFKNADISLDYLQGRLFYFTGLRDLNICMPIPPNTRVWAKWYLCEFGNTVSGKKMAIYFKSDGTGLLYNDNFPSIRIGKLPEYYHSDSTEVEDNIIDILVKNIDRITIDGKNILKNERILNRLYFRFEEFRESHLGNTLVRIVMDDISSDNADIPYIETPNGKKVNIFHLFTTLLEMDYFNDNAVIKNLIWEMLSKRSHDGSRNALLITLSEFDILPVEDYFESKFKSCYAVRPTMVKSARK